MRAVASAGANVEFGKQWQGQTADGRFPLEQYLGGSEQCAVFLTRLQDKSNGKAAIKLLLAGPDADIRLADWRRAAELSHPHLVRIFELGRCWLSGKELLYIVSEYGDENLAQVVPQRSLTNEEADAMLRPAVQALAFLHDRGLVHGHVRPSNVMAVADQLKLSTDGIRAAGAEPLKSAANAYDAPEAAASPLSPATDSWSLGVMLFEALTQRMPTSKAVIDSAGLRQPYSDIVRHCLMKDPSSRWGVRDIAGAIQLELPRSRPVLQAEKKLSSEPAGDSSANRPRLLMPVLIVVTLIAVIIAIILTVRVFQHVPTAAQQTQSVPQGGEPQAAAQPATIARSNSKGEVLHQVLPDPSAGALHTINGHLKVRVQVAVDGAGNVSGAKFVSAGPSKYFSRLSMEAAKQWRFAPAVNNGQPLASEWNLLFEFSRGGVKAIPQQVK